MCSINKLSSYVLFHAVCMVACMLCLTSLNIGQGNYNKSTTFYSIMRLPYGHYKCLIEVLAIGIAYAWLYNTLQQIIIRDIGKEFIVAS